MEIIEIDYFDEGLSIVDLFFKPLCLHKLSGAESSDLMLNPFYFYRILTDLPL